MWEKPAYAMVPAKIKPNMIKLPENNLSVFIVLYL